MNQTVPFGVGAGDIKDVSQDNPKKETHSDSSLTLPLVDFRSVPAVPSNVAFPLHNPVLQEVRHQQLMSAYKY